MGLSFWLTVASGYECIYYVMLDLHFVYRKYISFYSIKVIFIYPVTVLVRNSTYRYCFKPSQID